MGLVIGVTSAAVAIGYFSDSWVFWLLWGFAGLNLYGWWTAGRK